jgi:hypothetical protein
MSVSEQNTDANGNIKVHEQGTANVNVTNTNLSIGQPAPVTGGVTQTPVVIVSPATDTLFATLQTATGLSITMPVGTTDIAFFDGPNEVAGFLGPGVGGSSVINIALTRPIAFDRVDCNAGPSGPSCFFTWTGATP